MARRSFNTSLLELESGTFTAPVTFESGGDAGPFVFTYETTGLEPEGTATIRGDLVDAQGRVSRGLVIGTVELDYHLRQSN